jgi:DNA-binding transcriptional LysR family regulator
MGLIYITEDKIKEGVGSGKLTIIPEEFAPGSDGYYLYYLNISQVSPKQRAFIDYLKAKKKLIINYLLLYIF